MSSLPPYLCGLVPSLEVLPLVAAREAFRSELQFKSCPGYGRIIRLLLTGELQAGILPWELFVSEILSRPGQADLWTVPLALNPGPMELVLHRSAWRLCHPSPPRDARPARRLTFAIEARRSLSRLQIAAWLQQISGASLPLFKVLPMDLMLKGLEARAIDGIVAPAPWGLLAAKAGSHQIVPSFNAAQYGQQVVLVCLKSAATAPNLTAGFKNLPKACREVRMGLQDPGVFKTAATAATGAGWAPLTADILQESARFHSGTPVPGAQEELVPDGLWIKREMEILVHHSLLEPEAARNLGRSLLPAAVGGSASGYSSSDEPAAAVA